MTRIGGLAFLQSWICIDSGIFLNKLASGLWCVAFFTGLLKVTYYFSLFFPFPTRDKWIMQFEKVLADVTSRAGNSVSLPGRQVAGKK